MTSWEKELEKIHWRKAMGQAVPPELMKWLKEACMKAQSKENKANRTLIGHIKEEYHLNNWSKEFENWLIHNCLSQPNMVEHTDKLTVLNKPSPFYLQSLWVNFQKRYEFNPPHNHSGVYSFVIFVKIPYNAREEYDYFSEVGGLHRREDSTYTSQFAFLNVSYDGTIRCDGIEVDKSFEGKIIMFPAKQLHMVFPFYTSKGYRITVSGNIRLKAQ